MDKFRFSPIENKEKLIEAIIYTHLRCLELCKNALGKYLPVSGNIGIFCHYENEYEFLIKLREELTDKKNNWNQKYFRLHEPIFIPAKDNIPAATYTYLYIRHPDSEKPQVGDVDLVIGEEEFSKLKNTSLGRSKINEIDVFYRPDLDMIRLSDSNFDVLPYITTTYMDQKGV